MKKMNKILISFVLLLFSINIHSKIEELNLESDNGYYKKIKNQKIFVAEGNARIDIDKNEVFCDEIEIFLSEDDAVEKTIFRKNIIIFQEDDKVQIGGEYAEYFKKEKKFVIRENAFYIDVKDEVAVFGDSIHNYEKESVAIIQGNVRIFQKEIYSKGAFVKYSRRDKLMEISGFPTVENQGSVYSAKKIIIDIENSTFLLEGGIEATILNEESINPFNKIEAEDFNGQNGIKSDDINAGGRMITDIQDGEWIRFDSLDFSNAGIIGFVARVAANTDGCKIEIRLNSNTGILMAECQVSNTGGMQTWKVDSCPVFDSDKLLTGVKSICLVFKGESETLFNLDHFTFIPGDDKYLNNAYKIYYDKYNN